MRRLILAATLCMAGAAQANANFTAQYEGTMDCSQTPYLCFETFNPTLYVETTSAADGNYWGVFGRNYDSQFNTLISADLWDIRLRPNTSMDSGYSASVNVTIRGGEVTFFGGTYFSFYHDCCYTEIGPNTVTYIFSDAVAYRIGTAHLVVPVPEPETYALVLGGLAALAFKLRRKGALLH